MAISEGKIRLKHRVALLSLLSLIPLVAENADNAPKNTRYLALGDSVSFGYNPTLPVDLKNYRGYPEFVSDQVHMKVANASCVGESSPSFLSAGAPDLGCGQWKQYGAPMFVPYAGSQIDYAVTYLRNNPNPKLVTINIGGNDLGLLQQKCGTDLACAYLELPIVYGNYAEKLATILTRLREEGGYRGRIVLLTYYAFDYSATGGPETLAFVGLNSIASGIANGFGALVADGFNAFAEASIQHGGNPCNAGLLIRLPNGACDVHPSIAGQKVLADAIVKALN